MTLKPSSFPTLKQAFSGYLHEDFGAEHGTAPGAIRAFLDEASPGERARFWKEAERLLAETADWPFADVRALLSRLGSRWAPASRDAVVSLLTRGA
jgi:hypothetical protein